MNKDEREQLERQRKTDDDKRHADNLRRQKLTEKKAEHLHKIDQKALEGCKTTVMMIIGLLLSLAVVVVLFLVT